MTDKDTIKAIQRRVGTTADGVIGRKTLAAICKALGIEVPSGTAIPTQSEVRRGNSIYGRAGDESNLVTVDAPYTLYVEGKATNRLRVHKAIADRVQAALRDVLTVYGKENIHRLKLDVYDGCFNNRSTVSGKSKSMHAWGIALDFCAEDNTYSMKAPKARFSGAEYKHWWEIWESHGAVSLGRERDYDWMHLQFATLG